MFGAGSAKGRSFDGINGINRIGRQTAEFFFVFQACCSEVQKQTSVDSRGGEIVDKLNFVGGIQRRDSFEFENEILLDEEIALKLPNIAAAIKHLESLLPSKCDASLVKFDSEGIGINTFKKTRAECPVDLHGQPNDNPCQIVFLFFSQNSVNSVNPVKNPLIIH